MAAWDFPAPSPQGAPMKLSCKSLLACAAIALTLASSPAIASASGSSCTADHLCVFKNANYGGPVAFTTQGDSDYSDNMFTYCDWACELNDSVSSIDNDMTIGSRHYVHRLSYTGSNPSFLIQRGGYRATLIATYDDDLSAHRLTNS